MQATPLADEQDAEAARNAFWSRTLRNLAAQVKVIATQDGPAVNLPGSTVQTVEQLTKGPAGQGAARYLVWSHGRLVSALCGSAFGQPWPWESLEELARKQNQRIDAVIRR